MRLINGKEYPDNLQGANLQDADLYGVNLRSADLHGANLRGADLQSADLRGADLQRTDLQGTDLRGTDLRGADLKLANLSRANLCCANLDGTKLYDTVGNSREVISLQTAQYRIAYTATHLQIGCQYHSITEWMAFDDKTIEVMDIGALYWWTHHKQWIQDAIRMNPATSTPVPS
jgi:hypothetical protein